MPFTPFTRALMARSPIAWSMMRDMERLMHDPFLMRAGPHRPPQQQEQQLHAQAAASQQHRQRQPLKSQPQPEIQREASKADASSADSSSPSQMQVQQQQQQQQPQPPQQQQQQQQNRKDIARQRQRQLRRGEGDMLDRLERGFLNPWSPALFGHDPFFGAVSEWPSRHAFRSMQRMMEDAEREMRDMVPALEVIENDKNYLINIEIPGVRKGDLKVTLSGDDNRLLTVVAERKEEMQTEDDTNAGASAQAAEAAKTQATETTLETTKKTESKDAQQSSEQPESQVTGSSRSYTHSRFVRSFELPEDADTEHVSAKHEDGVLRLTVPKRTEQPPKPQRDISIN